MSKECIKGKEEMDKKVNGKIKTDDELKQFQQFLQGQYLVKTIQENNSNLK